MKDSIFCIIAIDVKCYNKRMYTLQGCSGRLPITGKYR